VELPKLSSEEVIPVVSNWKPDDPSNYTSRTPYIRRKSIDSGNSSQSESYDSSSNLPVMISRKIPSENIIRKVVEKRGVQHYYIGDQEVDRETFVNSI
jgi:hypothetical protein